MFRVQLEMHCDFFFVIEKAEQNEWFHFDDDLFDRNRGTFRTEFHWNSNSNNSAEIDWLCDVNVKC